MVHFLSTFRAGVHHDAETTVRVRIAALFQRQPRRQRHHAAEQSGMRVGDTGHGMHVFLGHHEEVDGRGGVDVVEGEDFIVLVDLPRGDLAGDDLAEEAVGIVHGG